MRYDITLRIRYEYEEPVMSGRQVVRLMPAELPAEQSVLTGSLTILPTPDDWWEGQDFWHNATVSIVHRQPHARLEYSVQARVERLHPPPPGPSVRLDELPGAIDAYRGLGPEAPHHFRGPSPRVPVAAEMTTYARAALADGMTVADAVEAIGRNLHRDMQFDPEATKVDTPVEEAFNQRRGVCQDFTHVMIAGLRGVGIPAGYVSGYLRTIPPEGKPRLEGADAMHAWVRAWCGPGRGWMEFDPTNAMPAGRSHIVVARGRDYSDVAPIKGVLRTFGSHETTQAVDVVPLT